MDIMYTQAKEALEKALNSLVEITAEALVRKSELGTSLDFSKGVGVFERTLKLFKNLRDASLDNLPLNVINQLKQSAAGRSGTTSISTGSTVQSRGPEQSGSSMGHADPTN